MEEIDFNAYFIEEGQLAVDDIVRDGFHESGYLLLLRLILQNFQNSKWDLKVYFIKKYED